MKVTFSPVALNDFVKDRNLEAFDGRPVPISNHPSFHQTRQSDKPKLESFYPPQ